MSENTISRIEAIEMMSSARLEHDSCPECGNGFEDVDMTRGGDLVFIHAAGMCSRETEVDRVE